MLRRMTPILPVEQVAMRDRSQLLRIMIFLLGGLETVAVVIVLGIMIASGQLFSGEELSRELAWVPIMVFGLPYLTFVVPAAILAIVNRYLLTAFSLCALFPPIAFVAFIFA
jgi:hypothetical protein